MAHCAHFCSAEAHLELRWLIVREMAAHCWISGGSLLEMWWLIGGDWRSGSSLLEMRWLIGNM